MHGGPGRREATRSHCLFNPRRTGPDCKGTAVAVVLEVAARARPEAEGRSRRRKDGTRREVPANHGGVSDRDAVRTHGRRVREQARSTDGKDLARRQHRARLPDPGRGRSRESSALRATPFTALHGDPISFSPMVHRSAHGSAGYNAVIQRRPRAAVINAVHASWRMTMRPPRRCGCPLQAFAAAA